MPTSQQATVLHIHFWADIRNSAGSVEKVITAFASHGQAYRHEIACCPTEPSVPQIFEHHGVTVHAFRESRLVNRIFNKMLRLNAFTFSDLVRLINRLQPAILHFHNRQELVDSIVRRLNYRPVALVHYHRHFASPVIPTLADRLLFISQRTADDILGKTGTNKPSDIVFNPYLWKFWSISKNALTRCLRRACQRYFLAVVVIRSKMFLYHHWFLNQQPSDSRMCPNRPLSRLFPLLHPL